MDGVNNWLHNLAAPFFDEGLQKVVSQYKCLNVGGNYRVFNLKVDCQLSREYFTSDAKYNGSAGMTL
jgi:hypothetical protein